MNDSWERIKINTVSGIPYMGKGTAGRQLMREEVAVENEDIVIPTQVGWLANLRTIRDRGQNGEIGASSVVFIVKGSKVAQS